MTEGAQGGRDGEQGLRASKPCCLLRLQELRSQEEKEDTSAKSPKKKEKQ